MSPVPDTPAQLARFLLELGMTGIELARHPADPARLRHRPAELPPHHSARLRLHRDAIRKLLEDGYAPADESEAEYVLGERLGVAADLGMATHLGSLAWLIAIGEAMKNSCPSATYVVRYEHGSTDEGHRSSGESE
jgi:hypothetical protein